MDRCQEIYDRIIANGPGAIEEFIADRKSEDLFLDFKRSSDNGAGRKLSSTDRKHLAKAISGFGNSEGGVVVWGVDCSLDEDGADVPRAEVFIINPARFASLLQGVVSGCTFPPHAGVQNHVITVDEERGFVITLIPTSHSSPHQMLPDKRYYIRAGSAFVPTPHDVLAGMFGRRPHPHLRHQYNMEPPRLVDNELKITFGLLIHNFGPGIASDVYCTCFAVGLPGNTCQMEFEIPNKATWRGTFDFGVQASLITVPGYRLPPRAKTQPVIIHLTLIPPFEDSLKIISSVGAGESRGYEFVIETSREQIQKQYDLFVQKAAEKSFSDREKQEIVEAILVGTEA